MENLRYRWLVASPAARQTLGMLTPASSPASLLSGDAVLTENQLYVMAIKIQMDIQEQNPNQIQWV